jgi:hypothetical protein
MRVSQLDIFQTLVRFHMSISDHLHLRLVRDSLEIWMEDASLCINSLSVSIAL